MKTNTQNKAPFSRVGRFTIPVIMMERNFPAAQMIFSRFEIFPVRCEHMYRRNEFEYIALSNYFDDVPPDHEMPEYGFEVTESEDGTVDIKLQKLTQVKA